MQYNNTMIKLLTHKLILTQYSSTLLYTELDILFTPVCLNQDPPIYLSSHNLTLIAIVQFPVETNSLVTTSS